MKATEDDVPITDGLMHELGRDGTIDASTDCSNDPPFLATQLANAHDFFCDERFLRQTVSTGLEAVKSCAVPSSSLRHTRRC